MSRCYIDPPDTACAQPAKYEARVTWTAGLMRLCEEHAAEARADGDVIEIRSITTPEDKR